MDFNFTDEQNMLRDSARGFCEKMSPMGYVLDMEKDEKGYTPELWNGMAELGWMGLMIPEEYGGIGMGFMEMVVLLEEHGRMCVPGPFFSTAVCGALTIMNAGSEEQKKEYLQKIAEGKLILSLAVTEPGMTKYDPTHISVTASRAGGDDFIINGTKLFVNDAQAADIIICAARTSGKINDEEGITLFMVDKKASGVAITPLSTLGGDKQYEVVFDNVKLSKAQILGEIGRAYPVINKVFQYAAVGKCAEMVGGAKKILELALDYCHQRVQFGKPIGLFQAVQHHCANMAIYLHGSQFITYKAAWMLSEGIPCAQLVAAAKAWVSQAYKKFGILGHQVFGGTGFINEHEMPMYTRRARAAELAFGDANYHCAVMAKEMGLS